MRRGIHFIHRNNVSWFSNTYSLCRVEHTEYMNGTLLLNDVAVFSKYFPTCIRMKKARWRKPVGVAFSLCTPFFLNDTFLLHLITLILHCILRACTHQLSHREKKNPEKIVDSFVCPYIVAIYWQLYTKPSGWKSFVLQIGLKNWHHK